MLVGHPCLDKWPQPHDGADGAEWSQWVIKEIKGHKGEYVGGQRGVGRGELRVDRVKIHYKHV